MGSEGSNTFPLNTADDAAPAAMPTNAEIMAELQQVKETLARYVDAIESIAQEAGPIFAKLQGSFLLKALGGM